jgi:RNA polymerase sigma factor (sigma-70 family)
MHNHILPAGGLSESSEAALFEWAQAGCSPCLDHLMMHHRKLVIFVVRRQGLGQLSFQDALQAGRLGLWHAIRGFDPQKGYAFSTYAYPAIARSIWRAVRQAERDAQATSTRVASPDALAGDPEQEVEAHLVQAALDDLVRRLPKRLRVVIIARYGLAGKPPALLREIGSTLGLSGERVRLLLLEALVWLRHPAHSQELRSLLGRHTVADYEWAEQLAHCWLRRRRGGRYGAD